MTDYISRADAIEAVAEEWLSEASAESPYVNDDDIGEYRKLAEKLFEDVPSADADGEDLIIKGAKGIQDGLYNIKDGKLFKYKAKGGTVRTYPIVPSADAVHGEDNEIIKAIHTINNFLDTQGVFLATSMWRAKDGTILSCDWGYFDEGMREIEKYLKGGAE